MMINMDLFLSQNFPTAENLKNLSSTGISFIRYHNDLYRVMKFVNKIEVIPMEFHPMTLKILDEEMKPTDIPRLLSEAESNYIIVTMRKINYKMVVTSLFEHCYPHEAASLSLGVVANKLVYYCNEEKSLRFRDKEVKDRTMMLCDHNPQWYKELNNYRFPLCKHIDKLLINPSFDIDKILLNLMEEQIFLKDKEDELLNNYTRLANQFPTYRIQNDASKIGKKGNKERNEPHQKAKMMAINYCKDLLQDEKNQHLKSHQIIKAIIKHLTTNEKIFNPYKKRQGKNQAYAFKTVKTWINHLIPTNRKTIGSPKKEIPYCIYTVPND